MSLMEEFLKSTDKVGRIDISECNRDDLPQFFVEMDYRVGAEIGVHLGEFSEKFCKVGLKIHSIDPWLALQGQGRTQNIQENQDANYAKAQEVLGKYDCTVIRESSRAALRYFANGSLDFVYVDGNHMLLPVIEDILEWSKKVRSGGVVSGHDYFCTWHGAKNVICQVRPAVNACIEVLGVEKFYIIDSASKYPSWMWVKV